MTRATPPKVVFVCWGNICRSPMAEVVARQWFADADIAAVVSSAGVSDEEHHNPIDRRAKRTLEDAGYEVGGHRAREITASEIRDADLVIAAEPSHVRRMQRVAPDATNLHLISEYDPTAAPGASLPDPWCGGPGDFLDTLDAIERAMPGIVTAVRDLA